MEKQGPRCRRLVLVPFPFQGHINPMLQLGAVLHSKGFFITISHTRFNFPNSRDLPHFSFLTIPDGLFGRYVFGSGLKRVMHILNDTCGAPLQESLMQMIQDPDGLENDEGLPCIIYDGLMYFAESVARNLKLPSITFRVCSAANTLTYNALPSLLKEGSLPLQDSRLLAADVPGLQHLRFKDLPAYDSGLDVQLFLADTICDARSSSAVIWNTAACLEQPSLAALKQRWQVPIFPIGPMHKIVAAPSGSLLEEETSCIAWLDKQAAKSVIYVSFGSTTAMHEKELTEMAWGLTNSKQPFLWVIRPGSVQVSKWIELPPDGFREAVGERGCIVKWAPQKEVLAHVTVGGFWSYCGWNSTLESISEGVPMLCRPNGGGDQRVNARIVSGTWGVGLELENHEVDRGEIERAVRRLMVGKEGEEMRERAMELKRKVQLSINKNGSSYDSLNELVEFIMSL